jgi:hypothetical protein
MFGWLGGGNNEAPVYPELEAPQSVDGELQLIVFMQSFLLCDVVILFYKYDYLLEFVAAMVNFRSFFAHQRSKIRIYFR